MHDSVTWLERPDREPCSANTLKWDLCYHQYKCALCRTEWHFVCFMCVFIAVCVCAVFSGNQAEIRSACWMGEKRACFPLMCAPVSGGEEYILGGDGQSGGTRILVPAVTHLPASNTKGETCTSTFWLISCVNAVCWGFCFSTYSPGLIMEPAISTLITQFKTYAGKDGSSSTLSKDEFHNLVTAELPNLVKVNL